MRCCHSTHSLLFRGFPPVVGGGQQQSNHKPKQEDTETAEKIRRTSPDQRPQEASTRETQQFPKRTAEPFDVCPGAVAKRRLRRLGAPPLWDLVLFPSLFASPSICVSFFFLFFTCVCVSLSLSLSLLFTLCPSEGPLSRSPTLSETTPSVLPLSCFHPQSCGM